jgi:hypothetical protein
MMKRVFSFSWMELDDEDKGEEMCIGVPFFVE